MSHQEKLEEMSKEKWMDQIQSFHITRADMNRLIMNYLVTGKFKFHITRADMNRLIMNYLVTGKILSIQIKRNQFHFLPVSVAVGLI